MKYIPTALLLESALSNLTQRVFKTNSGVSSGYALLDQALGGVGFKKGSLCVIAGRPSMGKSLVAINILVNQLRNLPTGAVIVYCTGTMSATILIQKIMAIAFRLDIEKIQSGTISIQDLAVLESDPFMEILKKGLVIVEKETPTITAIKDVLDTLIQEGKTIQMVTIDTLQNVKTDGFLNSEQGIAEMLKQLKVIANQLQFPVLLLSEVSRNVEYRKGPKIPLLKDLKGSRLIADNVQHCFMVLRPFYYEIPGETPTVDEALHLICKKNIYGPLDMIDFKVDIKKQTINIAPSIN
jgi:replicative DNA helicase